MCKLLWVKNLKFQNSNAKSQNHLLKFGACNLKFIFQRKIALGKTTGLS